MIKIAIKIAVHRKNLRTRRSGRASELLRIKARPIAMPFTQNI